MVETQRKSGMGKVIFAGVCVGAVYVAIKNPEVVGNVVKGIGDVFSGGASNTCADSAHASITQAGGYRVAGPATLSCTDAVKLLANAHSPAAPVAAAMWNQAVSDGINPGYIFADFKWESSYGKNGVAVTTKDVCNMKTFRSDLPSYGGFQDYSSMGNQGYVESVKDCDNMLHRVINSKGSDKVNVVEAVLAPPIENNTNLMIRNITVSMWENSHGLEDGSKIADAALQLLALPTRRVTA